MKHLFIVKECRTVWGLTGLDGYYAYGKEVTSWEVIDGDSGKIVYGGIVSGGNTQKGYAKVSRKKDAKSYIDGFNSYHAGEDQCDQSDNYDKHYGWYVAEFKDKA